MVDGTVLASLIASVTAIVEFGKPVLLQTTWFKSLTDQQQSIVLQLIAIVAAAGGSFYRHFNLFGAPDDLVGTVLTGLTIGLGGQFVHLLLAVLGINGNVTAQAESATTTKRSYTAWS